ncbi:N-acetylmuramoyl-L-alanine amidase [Phyllobacterium lublinensis]|uniref:N-acetylmuramoyl-L-alanine amidase n=1 Tax=Phyllobacterium lublinensis TaxID=2875708 RepID=UPI001CCD6E5C|nr:N-acetylmuramoyl-L-alanine amidase [Phyllobacterium sp. 2063]MBZ9653564.1 N-acetylmuramoyl-L-alanine amidase [Phyllobacterium sp. 2063]
MRPINELIWHCTATPEGREVSVATIRQWHKDRGWSDIGYHKVVHLDGSVEDGRPESKVGAHCENHNTGTIGYVYVGGCDKNMKPKDTRTDAQKKTMLAITRAAIAKYGIKKVTGHNQYAAKACPSFDVRKDELGKLI